MNQYDSNNSGGSQPIDIGYSGLINHHEALRVLKKPAKPGKEIGKSQVSAEMMAGA